MLKAVPIDLKEAQAFIDNYHRHHISAKVDKFRVGCEKDGKLVGVAQVGRPIARMLDDGKTLEVLRLCTMGDKDVCSFLYSRCARIAKEMGYKKIITYILESETGTSLKASGWQKEAEHVGGAVGIANRDQEIIMLGRYHCFRRERLNTQQRKKRDGRKCCKERN